MIGVRGSLDSAGAVAVKRSGLTGVASRRPPILPERRRENPGRVKDAGG